MSTKFVATEQEFGTKKCFALQKFGGDTLPANCYRVQNDGRYIYVPAEQSKEGVVIAPGSIGDVLAKEVQQFMAKKSLYSQFKMPHKRGYLLYGDPGCGKSAVIRHLSDTWIKNNGIVILFNYNAIGGYEMLREAEPDRPIMMIVEDLDNPASDEEQILEFLDGQTSIDNTLFLSTTNSLGEIAKRLTARPSRIDRVIKVPVPTKDEKSAYITTFNISEEMKKEIMEYSSSLTFAQLKEVVLRAAIFDIPVKQACEEMVSLSKKRGKKVVGFTEK